MDEADARSEARRSSPIFERPRSVGGTASYATSIHEKQEAVRTAPHTDLQIQVRQSNHRQPRCFRFCKDFIGKPKNTEKIG